MQIYMPQTTESKKRDSSKEQEILDELNRLNFEYKDKKFVFKGNEEEFFDFLKEGYKSLEKLGEVYYSDKLKQKKAYINPRITAGINSSDSNYLEFNFQIEDINPAEYKKILEAFHEKRNSRAAESRARYARRQNS